MKLTNIPKFWLFIFVLILIAIWPSKYPPR